MAADVIEVDFEARRRERMSLAEQTDEILDELNVRANQIQSVKREASSLADEIGYWLRWERRRALRARRELAEERRANFPFTDDAVLAALQRAFTGQPASAKVVARELYSYEPTHSAVVRVGLALHRLREAGLVNAAVLPTRRTATRWAPVGDDDG